MAAAYRLSSSVSGSRDTLPSPVQQPLLQVGQPVEQQGAQWVVVEVQLAAQRPAGPAALAALRRLDT